MFDLGQLGPQLPYNRIGDWNGCSSFIVVGHLFKEQFDFNDNSCKINDLA